MKKKKIEKSDCPMLKDNENIECVYRNKKCHLCTKNGVTTEVGNYFAPYPVKS